MSRLSYENRVALLLSICIISAVVLLIAFFFIQKNKISSSSLQVQTPNIDLTEWRDALDALQEQQTQQEQPEDNAQEQEPSTGDISLEQTTQE